MSAGESRNGAPEGGGRPPVDTRLALIAAWLVPGAGHFLLGRRGRGLAFCAIILVCLLIGLHFEGNLYRVVSGRPLTVLATLASMGMGTPYFVLRFGLGYEGRLVAPGYDYGTAFILTAGLMNLLLLLDVLDIARGRKA